MYSEIQSSQPNAPESRPITKAQCITCVVFNLPQPELIITTPYSITKPRTVFSYTLFGFVTTTVDCRVLYVHYSTSTEGDGKGEKGRSEQEGQDAGVGAGVERTRKAQEGRTLYIRKVVRALAVNPGSLTLSWLHVPQELVLDRVLWEGMVW